VECSPGVTLTPCEFISSEREGGEPLPFLFFFFFWIFWQMAIKKSKWQETSFF
jgi:hypothetical protein